MDRPDTNNGQDLYDEQAPSADGAPQDPEQVHPVQDAHGGSMAPGAVDDTGHLVGDPPVPGADG